MAGDLLAQHFGHHGGGGAEAGFDALRVVRLGLYGLCIDGPLGSLWCVGCLVVVGEGWWEGCKERMA